MTPPSTLSWLAAFLALTSPTLATSAHPKRGLVFTPDPDHGKDNYIWTRPPTSLTWYYNYGASPSVVYDNLTQSEFEFVPMLWGAPSDANDTTFLTTVQGLISGGTNISHVMTFNEPDGATGGGSNVDPTLAAKVWVSNIEPLTEAGVKAGLPACTGGWGGLPWMRQFLGNCSALVSAGEKTKRNCTFDFVPLHWYGNFDGLASHIGEWAGAFPNTSIWVTEYNYDNQDLATTQSFFNSSVQTMDSWDQVERYSFFGAFRSSKSNVGPNGAMLSAGGQLTDMGAWYLDRPATGVLPSSTKGSSGATVLSKGWTGMVLGGVAVMALLL